MIQLSGIYLQYGERILLNSISLTLKQKERVALVGRNGAGKSTLLKIIAGEKTPDKGNVDKPTATTIGYLHQDIFVPEEKSVIEEAMTAFDATLKIQLRLEEVEKELETRTDYESDEYQKLIEEISDLSERFQILDGQEAESKAERILKGLGFKSKDLSRKLKEFSGGWKMRVELAKILLRQPDYMLLDEPTNHLDLDSILWLEEFLKTYPGTIITISHDRAFLDSVSTKTVEVELGNIYEYNCNYSKFLIQREERRTLLKAQYENQQKLIAEKQKTIDRFKAKANKAKMAQSMMKELERMDRIELEDEDVSGMRINFPPAPRAGAVLFETENLSKSYGALNVLNEVELMIERGDKVAFVGQNGQGKSTLSKIIAGEVEEYNGQFALGHNAKIGYYAQDQADSLDPTITLLETMENAAPPELRTRVRNILGSFMFTGEDVEKKVVVLSGGERARLAMAKLLLNDINLLILDEPTNHLDIVSKEILKEALKRFDGTMIVVSHDRDFLEGLTNRTIEFRNKKLYDYIGDVFAFLEKRKADSMRNLELADEEIKEAKPKAKKVSPQVNPNDKRIKFLEGKIDKFEKSIAKLEVEMGEEGFYESQKSTGVLNKHKKQQAELAAFMEEWESLI